MDDVIMSTLRLGLGDVTTDLTSSAFQVMASDLSRCPGNCSGHGTCMDGQCLCLVSEHLVIQIQNLSKCSVIRRYNDFLYQMLEIGNETEKI